MGTRLQVGKLNQDWILQQSTSDDDDRGGTIAHEWTAGTTYLAGTQTIQARRRDEQGREFTETLIKLTTRRLDVTIDKIQNFRWKDRKGKTYKIQSIENVDENDWIAVHHLLPE